ncbi:MULTISPECIES: hypothetical protein [unclassified Phyllobacterium]|uniref:hypothetical protein n=1 Tax=unclassified Phyllobacterium TaxID=2638441 RepID=UPI003012EC5B
MRNIYPKLSFECSRCENYIEFVDFELPGYDISAEVHSEGQGLEEVEVECDVCRKIYIVQITNMLGQYGAEIDEALNIDVHLDVPDEPTEFDYTEFLKSYVPTEPEKRYFHSQQLIDEMLRSAGGLTTYPMFHRMLLLQYVAIMEAYLADRLITLVTDVEQVRISLIQKYASLGKQSYPLQALASMPSLIVDRTVTFLKSQLYHDLDVVDGLYESGLGQSPFPNDETKAFLKEAMINRHHCVHRDGKDNDGNSVHVDAEYVDKVRQSIRALVTNIEAKYRTEISLVKPSDPFS